MGVNFPLYSIVRSCLENGEYQRAVYLSHNALEPHTCTLSSFNVSCSDFLEPAVARNDISSPSAAPSLSSNVLRFLHFNALFLAAEKQRADSTAGIFDAGSFSLRLLVLVSTLYLSVFLFCFDYSFR